MVGRMGLEPTYDMVYKTIATTSLATALYFWVGTWDSNPHAFLQ